MNFFVGPTFTQDILHFKKLDYFRRRFDNRFFTGRPLTLSFLPPFNLPEGTGAEVHEELQEIFEGHFLGAEQSYQLEFYRLDFVLGKSSTLFLKAEIPTDFVYCLEEMEATLKKFKATFKKSSLEAKLHLPIGRMNGAQSMNQALENARTELNFPFKLEIKDVYLFEKNQLSQWNLKKLFTFSPLAGNLLEKGFGSSLV